MVSENKICIQFNHVTAKTRVTKHDTSDLELSKEQNWSMPIQNNGTDIAFLAVGIPLGVYPQLLQELFKACNEHMQLYPSAPLRSWLVEAHRSLGAILSNQEES